MTKSFELSFELELGSYIPFFSVSLNNYVDYIQDEINLEIFDNQVHFYTQIPNVISDVQIETIELGKIKIELDWSRVIEYLNRRDTRRYMECFPNPPNEYNYFGFSEDYEDEAIIFGSLIICDGLEDEHRYSDEILAHNYIYPFLYRLFLLLNLTSPGSFNLAGRYFSIGNSNKKTRLNLSDDLLAGTYHCTSKFGDWPAICPISLEDSWEWLRLLNMDSKPIAHSAIEKVIFSLLHACEQQYPPLQVMWLSIALEALFSTSADASIGRTLRDRILLVLGAPQSYNKSVRQLISSFYNLRSSFVHGGLSVTHPVEPYFCSEEVTEYYKQFNRPIAFATSVILATLQKCIVNRWVKLEFLEDYKGISS